MARAESLYDVYRTVGASLEDICGLDVLTELRIGGKIDRAVELPHNISALTKLKLLELWLHAMETLPAEMAYSLKHLQKLDLIDLHSLEYLPRSFTCSDAFPALIHFLMSCCDLLVEFPEVDKGALPKLRTLCFDCCESLGTLPLSLEVLTSLRTLVVGTCRERMKHACRINCEKSSIWRSFDIKY
jgi:hypothetical protein